MFVKKPVLLCMPDDSTLYTCAQTVEETTSACNKELQVVFNWISDNKLVLSFVCFIPIVFYADFLSVTACGPQEKYLLFSCVFIFVGLYVDFFSVICYVWTPGRVADV